MLDFSSKIKFDRYLASLPIAYYGYYMATHVVHQIILV